ncbi:MAG TPA: hypothetical protein ENL08_02155, partial [Bacteroidetes bacterium]|nr:hypothetical protein [Bacteroidota bacterium]
RMDDRMGVRSIRTDGNYDDHIDVFWLPAGSNGEMNELHYDDGLLAGGAYMINRSDIIATRFDPPGVYDILSLSIYILTRDDQQRFGLDENGNNALFFKVFAENPDNGMPGDLIIDEWVDEHFGWNVDDGWTTIEIDDKRFLDGPIYFGWDRDPSRMYRDEEIGGLDQSFDHEGTCFLRIDDNWFEYNEFPGDMMVRMVIWNHFAGEEQRLSPSGSRIARAVQPAGADFSSVRLVNPAAPTAVMTGDPFDWRTIFERIRSPRRDLFLHYQIYVDDQLIDEEIHEPFWQHDVGSDHENEEYIYRVEAVYETGEELGDAEAAGVANMPPMPPGNWWILNDGNRFVLSWDFPLLNEDSSDCVDFAGVQVFMSDRLAAVVDGENNSWSGEIEEGGEGWYNFRLIAFDEVPNMSRPLDFTAPLGVSALYGFERNEDDIVEAEPRFDGWEWSRNALHGPRGAHSGSYYWATRPFEGHYEDDADWLLTTLTEFRVETDAARLDFYQYYATEAGHDGGQVLISVDDGEWRLLEPDGGYPDQSVAGLRNTPGFTGATDDWELVSFDLSQYRNSTIRLRWWFASDPSISWYAGWYIDDLALWGCRVPDYASALGTVTDQDGAPVSEARVTCGGTSGLTDDDGNFNLTGILPGEYTVIASKPGYRGVNIQVALEPAENRELHLEIYHPRLDVDADQFGYVLGGGDGLDLNVTLSNTGDEPQPYLVRLEASTGGMRDAGDDRLLRGTGQRLTPARDDPWDTLFDFNLTEITGLERIVGAEFAGDRFFVTSGDPHRSAAVVVLDRDGNAISIFNQPFEQVGWGLRDLAWDGSLLYGSQDGDICSFDLDGNGVGRFEGAPLALNRALAYDPEADAFWATEWGEAWYLVD